MRLNWMAAIPAAVGMAVSGPAAADEMNEERISEGHKLYQLSCSVCHGDKGDGKTWATRALDPSPENFTEDPDHFDMRQLTEHIAEGCHDTAMQPFKYQLYVEEIEDVSAHILVNLLGWTVAEVNADLRGETHGHDDHDHGHGSHGDDHGDGDAHADKDSHGDDHDDHDSHADGGGCKPWNLEGVKTVAVRGHRP